MITDPRKYVAKWLELKKIVIDERGSLNSFDNREFCEIFDTLVLDYCQQIDDFNRKADRRVKGAPETNLKKALEEIISVEMAKRRDIIMENLKFSGTEDLSGVRKLVLAITGEENHTIVGVVSHLIWQIKRKLNGKDIVFHIMPILFGPQGGGKSLALQRLFKPLSNLTLELSLTEVTDARFYFALNRTFVVILDELAGVKKADVDALKKQISTTHNDARKLGSNLVTKIKQNASFIGTSNRPVNELIFDSTGARRFYEIKTLERLDWNTINTLDYISLYRGINENKEEGYIVDVLNDVMKDQENLIGIDEINVFLEQYKVAPGEKELPLPVLYAQYKIWAEENNMKIPNSAWFGRKLGNRNFRSKKKNIQGKTILFYLVGDDCDLLKKSYDPLASGLSKWN